MSSTALLVNPYDTEATAAAITRALDMLLEERKERWTAMMDRLQANGVEHWCRDFLSVLQEGIPTKPSPTSRRGRPVFGTGIAHVPG